MSSISYETTSEASEIATSDSDACSPLLLWSPTLPTDLPNFNQQPQSERLPSPSGIDIYSQADSVQKVATQAMAPVGETPLLFQSNGDSAPAAAGHVGSSLENVTGHDSLRATLLSLGEQVILNAELHRLDDEVQVTVFDCLKSC